MALKYLYLLGVFGGVGVFNGFGVFFPYGIIWITIIIHSLLQGEIIAQIDYMGLVQDTKES